MACQNNFVQICLISLVSLSLQVTGKDILCDNVETLDFGRTDIVETTYGKIVGRIESSRLLDSHLSLKPSRFYSSFKGIRYAKPPTGRNRFAPPIKAKPLTYVYEAFDDRSVCPQLSNFGFAGKFIGDEDCLFLNVYTPVIDFHFNNIKKLKHPKKAVMVYIHGGAFISGTGNSEELGPDFFVDKDVVLVTFNYRLGAPGFLNHQTKLISGNAGLKDQTLVLKWVQDNIERFGGDASRVTLFGQSAGAVAVDLHSISESSRNLFSRSIALSGSIFCPWAFQKRPLLKFEKLFKQTVFDPTMCLRMGHLCDEPLLNMDIQKLTEAAARQSDLPELELQVAPSVESTNEQNNNEPFLDQCYLNKIKNGDTFHGDFMFGGMGLEANMLGRMMEDKRESVIKSGLIKELAAFLANDDRLGYTYKELSLILFDLPINKKQMYLEKFGNSNSSYVYLFEYEETGRQLMIGAAHCDDLSYLFYKKGKNQICNEDSLNKDVEVRKHLLNMLTSFAKDGRPRSGQTMWPDFTRDKKYLKVTENGAFSMINGRPVPDQCIRNICTNINENESCDDGAPPLYYSSSFLKTAERVLKLFQH